MLLPSFIFLAQFTSLMTISLCMSVVFLWEFLNSEKREKRVKNLLPFLEFLSSIGNLNKYFFLSANSGF